jgi:hypothetical protein
MVFDRTICSTYSTGIAMCEHSVSNTPVVVSKVIEQCVRI